MPLKLIGADGEMSIPTAADVQARFDLGLSLTPAAVGRAKYERMVRELGDYFFYVGAVCPEHFRPLQDAVIEAPDDRLTNFQFTFPTWLYLLIGAPDRCAEHLARRLAATDISPSTRMTLEYMLSAMCTPAALSALGDYARTTDNSAEFESLGFWMPSARGAAVPRFSPHRLAAQLQPHEDGDPTLFRHPVGLPLAAVVTDADQSGITWHYCSLTLDDLPGVPTFPASRIHLVSPPLLCDWTVFSVVASDGRYTRPELRSQNQQDEEELADMRRQAEDERDTGRGQLLLLPYDDQLTYSNSHVESTPGVVGDVGGPPIGLYPNPSCPSCGRLMFHVATVQNNVREYGDGFRSLFLCEECGVVASHATMWN